MKTTSGTSPNTPLPSDEGLELIAARFRVLGEPSRLKLIRALIGGEMAVGALMQAAQLTQANTSRHLQTLTDAGILGRRKEGLSVIYFIADHGIFDLCEHVCGVVQRRHATHAAALQPGSNRAGSKRKEDARPATRPLRVPPESTVAAAPAVASATPATEADTEEFRVSFD